MEYQWESFIMCQKDLTHNLQNVKDHVENLNSYKSKLYKCKYKHQKNVSRHANTTGQPLFKNMFLKTNHYMGGE